MQDFELRFLLAQITPGACDVLRRAARANQWERDELTSRLMREPKGQDTADLIDRLSMNDDARRQVVRVLGELKTGS